MISVAFFVFAITLIYTGFLVSGRDLITGIAAAAMGLVLIIKPALDAVLYCMSHFGGGPQPNGSKIARKVKTRKVHLKVVKSEDDKPTIH